MEIMKKQAIDAAIDQKYGAGTYAMILKLADNLRAAYSESAKESGKIEFVDIEKLNMLNIASSAENLALSFFKPWSVASVITSLIAIKMVVENPSLGVGSATNIDGVYMVDMECLKKVWTSIKEGRFLDEYGDTYENILINECFSNVFYGMLSFEGWQGIINSVRSDKVTGA